MILSSLENAASLYMFPMSPGWNSRHGTTRMMLLKPSALILVKFTSMLSSSVPQKLIGHASPKYVTDFRYSGNAACASIRIAGVPAIRHAEAARIAAGFTNFLMFILSTVSAVFPAIPV